MFIYYILKFIILDTSPSTSSSVIEQPESSLTTPEPIPSISGIQTRTPTFRGISGVSKLVNTPRKKRLMSIVESKESHIRKLKKLCKEKSNNIKALCDLSDSRVVRDLFKGMATTTYDFLLSQLRCAKRAAKGRRWTIEEKIVALVLFKRSPKCYNLLRKIVTMPSRKTLLSLLQKVPFEMGINEHVFQHIKETVSNDQNKSCVLLFDEMDIKENVEYDAYNDRIVGFIEASDGSRKWANRALVFMLQGVARKWKQPVAYYFSNNGCSADILKNYLEVVISVTQNIADLDVVATICDMGSSNVKALREMGSSLENPYILFNEKRIYTIFDPPHLLKCTVSLFRKHNVCLPVTIAGGIAIMEAKFSDIVKAHEIDKKSPLVFRAMHKIKDMHLAPVMRYAMKVHIAAQVMSRTVSAFLYTLLSRGKLFYYIY